MLFQSKIVMRPLRNSTWHATYMLMSHHHHSCTDWQMVPLRFFFFFSFFPSFFSFFHFSLLPLKVAVGCWGHRTYGDARTGAQWNKEAKPSCVLPGPANFARQKKKGKEKLTRLRKQNDAMNRKGNYKTIDFGKKILIE